MFQKKTVLITGGTGSFGNAVLRRLLETDAGEIRIFSRDEKKQDDMRRLYREQFPEQSGRIKYYIGDVRDIQSVKPAMYGADFVFHAAALKQVPSCERFPMEAFKTNVLGTEHVLAAAVESGVRRVVCLSTDKAAYPVSAMGLSKAMMEKVAVAKAASVSPEQMAICCTRFGNIMCSRSSVIPLFISQIKAGRPLTVTDPDMTRFLMSMEEAVELVLYAFLHAQSGDILVQKAPACTVQVLAQAVLELFCANNPIEVIGVRPGEKRSETLLTDEEYAVAEDLGNFYRICAEPRMDRHRHAMENQLLSVEQVKEKLLKEPFVRVEAAAWNKEGRA